MDRFTALLDYQIVYALGWSIIHSFWQCLLVFVSLNFGLFLNKRARPETRYWLSMIALICCLLICVKTFIYCYQDVTQASLLFTHIQNTFNSSDTNLWWVATYQSINPWLGNIVLFWCIGFAIQALRYLVDIVLTQRLKHHTVSVVPQQWHSRFKRLAQKLHLANNIQFLQSTKVLVPCVIGHLKPVVLLPLGILSQIPQEQIEAIMLHELAHIKRHDYLLNILQCLVKVLLFFNPFVLAISKKIDIERENACDDLAVKISGEPLVFAHSLSSFASITSRNQIAMAASNDKYLLLARVKRLFAQPSRRSRSAEQLIALSCAGLLGLTLNVHATIQSNAALLTNSTPQKVSQLAINESTKLATNAIQTVNVKKVETDLIPFQQKTNLSNSIKMVTTIKDTQPKKSDINENSTEKQFTNSQSAATDYLQLASAAQESKNKNREHYSPDTDDNIRQQITKVQSSQLEVIDNPEFEKLLSVTSDQLQNIKYIAYAPIGLDNLHIATRAQSWNESTLKYLATFKAKIQQTVNIADNHPLNSGEYPTNINTLLVAQIRIQDIQHTHTAIGECKVPATVFASKGSGWTAGLCDYVEKIKVRFELILMDPNDKQIHVYGRKIIESTSDINKHRTFNKNDWQNNQEQQFWMRLVNEMKSEINQTIQQLKQNAATDSV